MIRQCLNAIHLHPCRGEYSLTAMSLCSDLRGTASHFDAQPPHSDDDQDIQSVHGRHTQVTEMPSPESDLFFSYSPHAALAYMHICSAEVACAHLVVQLIIHAYHFIFLLHSRHEIYVPPLCILILACEFDSHTNVTHRLHTRVSQIGAVAHPFHGFLCI